MSSSVSRTEWRKILKTIWKHSCWRYQLFVGYFPNALITSRASSSTEFLGTCFLVWLVIFSLRYVINRLKCVRDNKSKFMIIVIIQKTSLRTQDIEVLDYLGGFVGFMQWGICRRELIRVKSIWKYAMPSTSLKSSFFRIFIDFSSSVINASSFLLLTIDPDNQRNISSLKSSTILKTKTKKKIEIGFYRWEERQCTGKVITVRGRWHILSTIVDFS